MHIPSYSGQLHLEHVERCLVDTLLLAVLLGLFVLFLQVWGFVQVGDVAGVEHAVHVFEHFVVDDLGVDEQEGGLDALRAGLHQALLHVFLPVFVDFVVLGDFDLEDFEAEHLIGQPTA